MRLALVAFAVLGACSDDTTTMRIERQPAPLASATDDGWLPGSAVLVAAPGSLEFPQPLSLRITLVDPSQETPEPKPISKGSLALFGDTTASVPISLTCQPTYCDAQLELAEQGSVLVQLDATGKDGSETECFYYGIYEDPDPASVTAMYRDDLEAQQRTCLSDALE